MQKLRQRSLVQLATWSAAALAGTIAVLYARLIALTQGRYFALFEKHPWAISAVTPLLFVAAAFFVDHFAPEASGSGIPQVLRAIDLSKEDHDGAIWRHRLVALKTAVIKVISSWVGTLGGASIGREGPTVQIAASTFAWVGSVTRKLSKKDGSESAIEFHSFLMAGAAAGVAAAFNTPLAGITFALEEIGEGSFGRFRETVMLAVIIAGVTAMALSGDYLYFGHPTGLSFSPMLLPETIVIALAGGLLGGVFAKLLAFPTLTRLPSKGWRRALVCGVICAAIGFTTAGRTAGSGYEVTRSFLESAPLTDWPVLFSFEKVITTVLSYASGMAGGIFSPSLSIGAGLGLAAAKLAHLANYKECALIGMVAFFSGVVQAPLTAVVIVTEMTDEHLLIMPFMVAAFIALGVGKWLMPVPLYRHLSLGDHAEK